MTMELLNKYRENKIELDDIKAELAEYEVSDSVQSASTHPYSKHSVPVNGLPSSDRVISLLNRKAELEGKIRAVEEYINGIEDYQTKRMFKLKFHEGKKKKSYLQVAIKLGGGMTESCVKMRIARYLEKN